MDGDKLIVKKQEFCENGQIALILVENEPAKCRKVTMQDGGMQLESCNPLFPPLFYSAEAVEKLPVTIMGIVVRVVRNLIQSKNC